MARMRKTEFVMTPSIRTPSRKNRPELAHLKGDVKEYLKAYYKLVKEERRNAAGGQVCQRCNVFKTWEEYSDRQTQCKPCRSIIESARYAHNKEHARERMRERKFGLRTGQYQEMLDAQGGVCAICEQLETNTYQGVVRALAVDHDHDTGTVRGLLCFKCNSRLHAGTTMAWYVKAVAYLER